MKFISPGYLGRSYLSCLSESQIDRESEKHSFYEKILASPSKMGVMVVVIVLHECGIRDHH